MPTIPATSGTARWSAWSRRVARTGCARSTARTAISRTRTGFAPPPAEVERARRILLALDEAARTGRGAAQLDGRMIDAASARMAHNIVQLAAAIAARAGAPALASTRA